MIELSNKTRIINHIPPTFQINPAFIEEDSRIFERLRRRDGER